MKKIYSLLGLLLMTISVCAAPVSREQALGEARVFLLKNVQGKSGMRLAPARQSLSVGAEAEAFFIFNVGADQGFVVVSADDRTPAVLGYVDQGAFDAATCPAPLKSFLEGYAAEIRSLDLQPQKKASLRVTIKRAISPLLQTLWDQSEPYNLACPVFFDLEKYGMTVAGCVATAMSQVMKYYQWPEATTQAIPAYTCPVEFTGLGRISVPEVPAGTKFDWDNMLYEYMGNETEAQINAVARLIAATGASVAMDYRSDASGGSNASNSNVPVALQKYFNYAASTRHVERKNYLLQEWNEMIYNELRQQRVVIMGGQSTGGGHAFVVDGYSSDDYFHINWGWGGFCNGYFLLGVCNPGSSAGVGASNSSDGYSMSQDAIIGIEPNRGQAVKNEQYRMITQLVSAEGNEIHATYYSQVDGANVFNFGIGYVKPDGTLQPIDGWQKSEELQLNQGYVNVIFPVKGLADGTYKILPIGKLLSDSEWLSSLNPNISYVEAVVSGGQVQLKLVQPVPDFTVKSVHPQTIPMEGAALALDVEIENKGDEFYGSLYLRQDLAPVAQLGVSLPAESVTKVTFYFVPSAAGTFDFDITPDMRTVIKAGSLTVNSAHGATASIEVTDLAFSNPEAGTPYPNIYALLAGDVTVKNPTQVDFKDRLAFVCQLYDPTSGNYLEMTYYWQEVVVPASSEKKVHFEFPGVPEGYLCWPLVLASDGTTTLYADQTKLAYLHAGAIVFDMEGNREGVKVENIFNVPEKAIAVHFMGENEFSGVTGGTPNTLFFFDTDAKVPSTLTKNVIKGSEAQNIVLEDGYPFATPIGFVAKNISYTRTFKPAFTGKAGWESIVLPFDVTSVKADGKEVTWKGANAAFQLVEFSDERGQNVYFSGADKFEANVPYLFGFPAKDNQATVTFTGGETFIGTTFAAILTGQNVKMEGIMTERDADGILTLNAQGAAFERKGGVVDPFRAYFAPTANANRTFDTLNIVIQALTGVQNLAGDDTQAAGQWFTIDGRRVAQPRKGVYIRGGKKIVVK